MFDRKYLLLILIVLIDSIRFVRCCHTDKDCAHLGQCIQGFCKFTGFCDNNLDCLPMGFYSECFQFRCRRSSKRICWDDRDCSRTIQHPNKCIHYQCQYKSPHSNVMRGVFFAGKQNTKQSIFTLIN